MGKQILITVLLAVLFAGFLGCEQRSAYQQLEDRHYQKGAENDTLFLGYSFGMTRQEFFDHSWDLNRKQIVREGNSNQSVRYEVEELKSRAKMNFFPVFHQDSIYSMPVKYSYTGWAPWNRELWSDSLLVDLVDLYRQRYKAEFHEVIHPEEQKPAYVMIEGNKRISIYDLDDTQHVAVVYTDLDILNAIKEEGDAE